jgi:hypothetical protein
MITADSTVYHASAKGTDYTSRLNAVGDDEKSCHCQHSHYQPASKQASKQAQS